MASDQPLPAKVPLTLYRGDTRIWEDTFRSVAVAPATVGDPVDLTGFTFLAQIRAVVDDGEVMAVIDVEILDAPAGVIRRTLTAEQARNLTGESAYWDLQVTDDTGFVRTYMAGKVKILGDVSRV